jgi:hypothetical protein
MAMPLARASRLGFALLVVLATAIGAGCGGSSPATTGAADTSPGATQTVATSPTETSSGTTDTAAVSDALKLYTVESSGFAIGAPKGWKAVDSDTATAQIEKAAGGNATMKQVFEAMRHTGTKIRFIAGDPKATGAFVTNMNVVVEPVGSAMTLDSYIDANVSAISSVLGAKPEVEKVDLPAGEAAKFSYKTNRGRTLVYLQYALVHEGNGYVMTFTTVPATGSRYDDLFEQSAESFRLL